MLKHFFTESRLKDGTANMYVDDVLVTSHSNASTNGYVGIVTGGVGLLLYSMRVSPIERVILSDTYEADFTNTNELAKWDNLYGTNAPSLSNGKLVWGASNTDTAYLLPTRSLTNFVAETEITMVDRDFNKKWSFSGKGIFASFSGKHFLEISNNSICLYDFEKNYYEIDFNGNLLR